MMHRQANIR